MKPKVIIDCDPGHDDAIAIMMAAELTEIVGITTVSGNAPLDLTTDNALLLAELVGLNVEIHAGAEKPLLVAARHAEEAHGKTGLDGPVRPAVTRSSTSSEAVGFLSET
ncbi:MAG: nucleoside hydrolase, partial [Acidimicrobiales bacterium]|nr:nucleoside hydrolase [Acidimicrobiales bacterium]